MVCSSLTAASLLRLQNASDEEINQGVWGELALYDRCRSWLIDHSVVFPHADAYQLAEEGALERARLTARLEGKVRPEEEAEIKEQLDFLAECSGYDSWALIHPEGPLWFRGYARWSDQEGADLIEQLAETRGVDSFAVGHTPQQGFRIISRFDDRVFLMDTGMLRRSYDGRASRTRIRRGEKFGRST